MLRFFLPLLLPAVILAQASSNTVQASGSASVSVNPDQAQITVGVITDGSTAQDAAQKNSTQTAAVLAALKQVLGAAGTVQTVSYTVYPRYTNTQTPTIVGYTASNTLQAITYDLSNIGSLIDSANQAGANNVGGLSFGIREPEPIKQQALTQASKVARAHADAIAAGLNAKTGTVVSAQEVSTYAPVVGGAIGAAATTPIQTGQVSVTASVTVTVQLIQ